MIKKIRDIKNVLSSSLKTLSLTCAYVKDRVLINKFSIKNLHCFILALSLLFFAIPLRSQNPDSGYKKLIKRYGNATAWANGYIIKVNSYYGFANKEGKLLFTISNPRFDTLLHDRANISHASWGRSSLIDGNGKIIARSDGLYYHLLNRKNRLLAIRLKDNMEQFCTDKGEILFGMTYDARISKDKLLGNYIYDGTTYSYGIINFGGDTILPARYHTTGYSSEPGLYGGIRNDTAYVFSFEGKFLFSKHSVQNCIGINKDFIGLGKYGMYALVNRTGRLMTGFRYTYIEPVSFTDSVVRQSDKTHLGQQATANNYFITRKGSSRGLIDSNGKEILPLVYESIRLNSNGWLIVQKTLSEREELLNNRFESILENEAEGISFINQRYARIEIARNTAQASVKFYDMLLNRFVEKPPTSKRKTLTEQKTTDAENPYFYPDPDWTKNSVRINQAGSVLLKKKGRWGVLSITGDTILPFLYDTAFQHGAIFVGEKGKLAPIDWEGNLSYPIGISDMPQYWSDVDSQVIVKNNIIYSYKAWRLKKVEPAENLYKDPYLQFSGGIAYADGRYASRRGLYNRRMKKLGDNPYRYAGYLMVRATGLVAIEDSIKGLIAVVDSTGRLLIPWMKEPKHFMLRDHYALALGDNGKPDLLYRFEKGITLSDTVWLEAQTKFYIINDRERYYGPDDTRPLQFEKRGYGKGILNTKPVVLIKDAEIIDMTYEVIRIKIGGKWGLYDYQKNQLLPHEYDSIDPRGHFLRVLVKNGKTGFYHVHTKLLITPVYDSVCYENSYVMNYFIGYKNGIAEVVNTNGRVISQGWQNMKPLCHYSMESLAGTKNEIHYVLYPTLGDSLEALPYKGLTADFEIVERYGNGLTLITKNKKLGLYSDSESGLQIPAEYENIERINDYFFAKKSEPESLTLYTPKGLRMFALNGTYYDPVLVHQYQWQLWGPKGYMVVNSKGKIIVPPVYKTIQTLNSNGPLFYLCETQNSKHGLVDTSGKIIVQALYDEISDEAMYNGYRSVAQKGLYGLINPAGKLIAPCVYASLTSAKSQLLDYSVAENNCGNERNKKAEEVFFIVAQNVNQNLKYGLLNNTGTLITPCIYDNVLQVEDGKTMIVTKDGYYSLVTINGKPLSKTKYNYIQNFECGKAKFNRGDLEGYLTPDGNEILDK